MPDHDRPQAVAGVRAAPVDYRWARRPRWLLSHLFVLACVVLFVRLGFWQLSRLHERRAHNDLVAARQAGPPVPIGEVVRPGSGPGEVDASIFRHVSVTGTWRAAEQVLIRNETYQGAPGMWVVTPLVTADGSAVAVNRGWVPAPVAAGDRAAYAPAPGSVTVTGIVSATEERSGLGPTDPPEGTLTDLARVDVARLGRQVHEPLAPVYVTMAAPEPAAGALPQPVPPPVLDDGPHLNYAGQWFIFATLTCVVYPLLLRRTARQRAGAGEHEDEDEPAPVAATT